MLTTAYPRLGRLLDARRGLDVVDSHSCGQPTRVILSGAGLVDGMTPAEGRDHLHSEADWVRRLAVLEPRGHRSMFGAALIRPARYGDPYGVVFMDAGSYPDMCGHATIGIATTLCELGMVGPASASAGAGFSFQLQTPAGTLDLTATIDDGRCTAIAFRTPLAYYLKSIHLTLPTGRAARVDIAWGGQYYAFLPAESAGHAVAPEAIDQLIAAAVPVRRMLAECYDRVDPRLGAIPDIGNIVWTSPPRDSAAQARNVPVSSSNSFDRSPCGTATCARMAVMVARGELAIGETFVNESILGTHYHGCALASMEVAGMCGIVPQVRGSAWITAASRLSQDPTDPLGLGYLIGGGAAVV